MDGPFVNMIIVETKATKKIKAQNTDINKTDETVHNMRESQRIFTPRSW